MNPHRIAFPLLTLLLSIQLHASPDALIQTDTYAFRMSAETGAYELHDLQTHAVWSSNPTQTRFGEARVWQNGSLTTIPLSKCDLLPSGPGWIANFINPSNNTLLGIQLHLRPTHNGRALEMRCTADPDVSLQEVQLLDHAFPISGPSYALVPVREGLRIPANSGLSFSQRFDTYAYEGCHMAMFGLMQSGSALMVSWNNPYTSLDLESRLDQTGQPHNTQTLLSSISLRNDANSITLHVLGQGDETTIAKAYRDVARNAGWLVTWQEKLRHHPERAHLFGASNFKLWSLLDRRMSEDSQTEESLMVNWTFDEATQVAEHLKHELKLDRVLFLMGGWIHRGYDNQHPDILPAAPECGGDLAFSNAARRIRALGYTLGLHDNYQDIYRDSPSWNENLIMKRHDGTLATGGHWAGGRAYLTCSRQALNLALRPQNLPAVRKLTLADAYFIDTTYAAGLQECSDPAHPLSYAEDLHWKQELSKQARQLFGIFGSECGREWAIPYSDFFEGLSGVSGQHLHNPDLLTKLGATQVPLFELVYHNTIAIYGKYGYSIDNAASYVLHHISLARPLHYHNIPPHLYWQQPQETEPLSVQPAISTWKQLNDHRYEISYAWTVDSPPQQDWRIFVHFTDPDGNILFQNDHDPTTPTSRWIPGLHLEGPFQITPPPNLPDNTEIRIGLFNPTSGQRAQLSGTHDGQSRIWIGTLSGPRTNLALHRPPEPERKPALDPAMFLRADQGWCEGRHPLDRFLKNTHEILSPLNQLTATLEMSSFQFLTPNLSVRKTTFGQETNRITTTVNLDTQSYTTQSTTGGEVILPPGGFLIEAPTFIAFCASQWHGIKYTEPTLFTLTSQDNKPLSLSRNIRVFHAFGTPTLAWKETQHTVKQEAIIHPR